MDGGVDIVIPWVDGSDPRWRALFSEWRAKTNPADGEVATGGGENDSEIRYRDTATMRYFFRGVEKFAPWVRTVWFLTCGHVPEWLDTAHPKLRVVRHDDYIPCDYLPTFASRTIELNVHRIEGLSERFILFNDDMFLCRPVPESRFFRGGLPRDMARLSLIAPSTISHTVVNMVEILNRRHDRRTAMRRNFCKWYSPRYGTTNLLKTLDLSVWGRFAGLADTHMPQPYLKSTFARMWDEEYDILDLTCRSRFRSPYGVNHWLMRYEQLATGGFVPVSFRDAKLDALTDDGIGAIENYVRNQKYAMICLNDSPLLRDFGGITRRLAAAFEHILPTPSAYELP